MSHKPPPKTQIEVFFWVQGHLLLNIFLCLAFISVFFYQFIMGGYSLYSVIQ